MFAGRYMWWVLISTALFLFFSVYFPGVAGVWIISSGCGAEASGCGGLSVFLYGVLRPGGYLVSGLILLIVTAARLIYLRLGLVWLLFYTVWFIASGAFFTSVGNMWMANGGMDFIFESMPLEALCLAVFTLYLCLPGGDAEHSASTTLKVVQWVALAAAAVISLISLVQADALPGGAYSLTGSLETMRLLELGRQGLADLLVRTGAAAMPHSVLLLLFLLPITLHAILRGRPMAAE